MIYIYISTLKGVTSLESLYGLNYIYSIFFRYDNEFTSNPEA